MWILDRSKTKNDMQPSGWLHNDINNKSRFRIAVMKSYCILTYLPTLLLFCIYIGRCILITNMYYASLCVKDKTRNE